MSITKERLETAHKPKVCQDPTCKCNDDIAHLFLEGILSGIIQTQKLKTKQLNLT